MYLLIIGWFEWKDLNLRSPTYEDGEIDHFSTLGYMQGLLKGLFTKRACFSANDYNLGIACLFYTDRCDRYLKWE